MEPKMTYTFYGIVANGFGDHQKIIMRSKMSCLSRNYTFITPMLSLPIHICCRGVCRLALQGAFIQI